MNKFNGEPFDYNLEHVAPPEQIHVIGRGWRILNEPTSISFGGTVSPTADGFQLAELLAQEAVLKAGALVVSGVGWGKPAGIAFVWCQP